MATQRWEYQARNLKKRARKALEKDFNELGGEGWELVAAAEGRAIFKRPARRQAANGKAASPATPVQSDQPK
jgi:hypothetical protein